MCIYLKMDKNQIQDKNQIVLDTWKESRNQL